jgi:hypothetical protein
MSPRVPATSFAVATTAPSVGRKGGVMRIRGVLLTALLVLASGMAALLVGQAFGGPTVVPALGATLSPVPPASATAQGRPVLDLPTQWVPFTAKVRVFSPDMERVEGRFFRGSNGSQRLETGPPSEMARTIDIRNMAQDMHYLYKSGQGSGSTSTWTSAPMEVPEFGGRRPLKHFADQNGLRPYPYKLSFLKGQEPSVFADAGLDAYTYLDLGSNVHLQAPALNMFDLVNQSVTGQSRRGL